MKTKGGIILIITIALFAILCDTMFVYAISTEEQIEDIRKTIDELQKKQEQLKGDLASVRSQKESLNREIADLKLQTKSLENQILLTSKNINRTKIEAGLLEDQIFDVNEKVLKQKGSIARLMVFMDRQDSQPLVTTVLKSDNMSDFFRQAQYISDMDKQLMELVENLKQDQEMLERSKDDLDRKKADLEALNRDNSAKKSALSSTQSQKNTLLSRTKGQEATYQKMLQETERKMAEYFTELMVLEKQIVAGGMYIVHVTAKNIPAKGTDLFDWPEEDYVLTQSYGMTARAKRGAYGGKIHNGLDMASGSGSDIKAVAAGTVIASGKNKGWGNWVALKHAPYDLVTMYAHMIGPAIVAVGQNVVAGQKIGYEGNTGISTGSHLHFSVYKDFFTYNKGGELYFNYDGSINPYDYLK